MIYLYRNTYKLSPRNLKSRQLVSVDFNNINNMKHVQSRINNILIILTFSLGN